MVTESRVVARPRPDVAGFDLAAVVDLVVERLGRLEPVAATAERGNVGCDELDVEASDAREGSAPAPGRRSATSRAGLAVDGDAPERRHRERMHVEAGHADPPRRERFERHSHDIGARRRPTR